MKYLPEGRVLHGRYTIVEAAAEGGMSVIYRVRDASLPGIWALKEMRPLQATPADLEEIRGHFRREAQLLSGLRHQGIPRVVDWFVEDDTDYLVEEWIEGRTLDDLLEEKPQLPEIEVTRLAGDLLDILGYLHEHGIIYRDLKPGNVMVTADRRVMLIDFGIARLYTPGKSVDTVVVGTPGYASPEHYGRGQTDERSDLYALGATMHRMLTGLEPGDNPFAFTPPTQLVPGLSSGISDVIMRAVQLRREDRFASAAAMKGALAASRLAEPTQREYRYPAWIPMPRNLSEGGTVATMAGGLFGSVLAGPAMLLMIPAWLATMGVVGWARGRLHANLWLELAADGIAWHRGKSTRLARWEDIGRVRVRRVSGGDRTLFGPVLVYPAWVDVETKEETLGFFPAMPGWEGLVRWTVYRSGLHQVRGQGADEMWER